MGEALSPKEKEPYCHTMTVLYMLDSQYWNQYLNIILIFSALIFLGIFLQILFNRQL